MFGSIMTTPHKISNVKQYLMETFPLNFFLWGDIKGQVYATPPSILQDPRRHITDVCASVTAAMLPNVQREIQSRVQMCIVANGKHLERYK
ncbi:hypothetical protein AVEN_128820-1 [Araneus ventricosus]|uniref:Uncharacterized protein n=1 Tax=Araneus ventricosus TaxID=182803 RepID=A0A4Y2K4E9_ARAVE|nr:hypothetical protein AVEN_128820-1 [Araneus ventricosus]